MKRRGGRPLRFLALTLGGWAAARTALLWQVAVVTAGTLLVPATRPAPAEGAEPFDLAKRVRDPADHEPIAAWPAIRVAAPGPTARVTAAAAASPLVAIALAAMVRYGEAVEAGPAASAQGAIPAPLRPTPLARTRSRLAGSAWAIARGGGAGGLGGTPLGGQLGASQAGARLTYAIGTARRVALSARFATPFRGKGKEAAFGIDWQPTRMPLHVLAEQRVSLDGARGGPTLLLVGGIDPTPVIAGFKLEGYAQAGAIKRDGLEAFGDGAARLTHRLVKVGTATIDLGAGAWGAAQRGARRLDVGPTFGAVMPVAGKALRVTLDWRQRIAGDAHPDSGPALSIGTDF